MESIINHIDHAFTSEKKDLFSHRLFVYSILFLVMFLAFCLPVFLSGQTFIWRVDGFEQQYMFFLLEGEWLRQLFHNIFIQHQFIIPLWSDEIGYGADYINSLMNTLGNPINLLSVFATPQNTEYLLQATIPITLYLAGLAFLYYCQYHKFNCYGSIIGAVTYVFSGFTVIAFFQIYMLYPLILAPLVLAGTDKVFDRKSPITLVVGAALTCLLSAYTAYMMAIILFFYCVIKWWIECSHTAKSFFIHFFKILGCFAVGALIASVFLVPYIMELLSQDRLSLDRQVLILYPFRYYVSLFLNGSAFLQIGADCFIGFSPLAFIAFFYLFVTRKNKNNLQNSSNNKIFLCFAILMAIMVCIPFFGRMLNGFTYTTNRWVWAYEFVISVLVAMGISQALSASFKDRKKVAVILFAYCIISFFLAAIFKQQFTPGFVVLLLGAIVLLAFESQKHARAGMIVVAIVYCVIISYTVPTSVSNGQITIGEGFDRGFESNPGRLASDALQNSEYGRVDADYLNGNQLIRNESASLNLRMTNFYNSLYTEGVDDFHNDLGLASSSFNFSYNNLDGRLPLEVVTGSNVMLLPTDMTERGLPLYDKVVNEGSMHGISYSVLESDHVPNLAYVYHSTMSKDEYHSLELADRQESLLHSVVLDDDGSAESDNGSDSDNNADNSVNTDIARNIQVSDLNSASVVPPQNEPNDGRSDQNQEADNGGDTTTAASAVENSPHDIAIVGDQIVVKKPNTTIRINAEIPAHQEAILEFYDLHFTGSTTSEVQDDADRANMHKWEKLNQGITDLMTTPATDGTLECSSGQYHRSIEQKNPSSNIYGGKTNWLLDLGSSDTDRHSITITFSSVGTYTFSSMNIKAESNDALIQEADELCASSAQNIRFENNNEYSCQADGADDGGYLYLSVPYSSGWSATVDGQQAQIHKANDAFMAIQIPPGMHNVQLTYSKPYLMQGFILSCVGLVVLVALCIWNHTKRKCDKDTV